MGLPLRGGHIGTYCASDKVGRPIPNMTRRRPGILRDEPSDATAWNRWPSLFPGILRPTFTKILRRPFDTSKQRLTLTPTAPWLGYGAAQPELGWGTGLGPSMRSTRRSPSHHMIR